MQRIINFIIDNRISFLYAILMLLSLIITFRSHTYHNAKFFNSSKWVTGNVYELSNDIKSYFNLKKANQNLVAENKNLRQLIFANNYALKDTAKNTAPAFKVITGKVIKNTFSSPRNYITINLGTKNGLKKDMGVITPLGILGIVENTSSNFATVQSILNTKSSINAKIKNTNYFGSLVWNGKNYKTVQLVDIPRSVPIVVGDTIITGGMSSIFPEGIPIGQVKKYQLNEAQSFFDIEVGLFNNMANIHSVYVLQSILKDEQLQLEQLTNNAQ